MKLLAGSLLRNVLFHVASALCSLSLILQTKNITKLKHINTQLPLQGEITTNVDLDVAHSFISFTDSNNLPRHHAEAQPTGLHRRSQGAQRLAATPRGVEGTERFWTTLWLLQTVAQEGKLKGDCVGTGTFGGCFPSRPHSSM